MGVYYEVNRFGQPITTDRYQDEFGSPVEGASRNAIKRLTRDIEGELVASTVNAPDWYAVSFRVWRVAVVDILNQGYSIRRPDGSRLIMGRS